MVGGAPIVPVQPARNTTTSANAVALPIVRAGWERFTSIASKLNQDRPCGQQTKGYSGNCEIRVHRSAVSHTIVAMFFR